MKQQSLADGSFEKYRKKTRKEQFLEEMETIIPWQQLTEGYWQVKASGPTTSSPWSHYVAVAFFQDAKARCLINR